MNYKNYEENTLTGDKIINRIQEYYIDNNITNPTKDDLDKAYKYATTTRYDEELTSKDKLKIRRKKFPRYMISMGVLLILAKILPSGAAPFIAVAAIIVMVTTFFPSNKEVEAYRNGENLSAISEKAISFIGFIRKLIAVKISEIGK